MVISPPVQPGRAANRASSDPAEAARVLVLPGWQDSDADHWQSRWVALHGYERVEQSDWLWPRRGDWMARLDEVVLADDRPVVLVAHSLGCHLVAGWSAHSAHAARVRAALLVAPPDTERPDMPPQLHNWRPISRHRLPFASCAVLSIDDPYSSHERSLGLCAQWGADVVEIGACGHINTASGLGDWPQGHAALHDLMRRGMPPG